MKNLYFILILLLSSLSAFAQKKVQLVFCGTAGGFGPYNSGMFYTCTSDGTVKVLDYFDSVTDGWGPGCIIKAFDGNYYGGTAGAGGLNNLGTIFKCSLTPGSLTVIVNLDSNIGWEPGTQFVQAYDSNLYIPLGYGGKYGLGSLIRCTTSGVVTVLISFADTNGSSPVSIMQASDSNLYGMTWGMSVGSNYGSIFKYNIKTNALTTLFRYNDTNGAHPISNLIQAKNGYLYGTVPGGTDSGYNGTVFRCSLSGAYKTLHWFKGSDGNAPIYIIQGKDGALYGSTVWGGTFGTGVLFRYNISPAVYSVLYNFQNPVISGEYPGGLVQGSDSILYGTTGNGCANNYGGMFKYNIKTGTFDTLYSGNNSIGLSPWLQYQVGTDTVLDTVSAIKPLTSDGQTLLYPNPATNYITFKTSITGNKNLKIYNVSGKLIDEKSITTGRLFRVDVSDYPAGVYLYKLEGSGDTIIKTGKFSVIR